MTLQWLRLSESRTMSVADLCAIHNICGDILSVGVLVKINKVEIINEY